MANVICLQCRREFSVKPSQLALGWGKYCSTECRNSSQFKGEIVNCFICKREEYKPPLVFKRSKSGKYFCTKKCQTLWRNKIVFVGENHANWRTGEGSYRRRLKASEREKICMLCRTLDTRVLMVHHFDKDRSNNSLDNLVWLCNNCHYLVHHYPDEQDRLKVLMGK